MTDQPPLGRVPVPITDEVVDAIRQGRPVPPGVYIVTAPIVLP